MPAIWRILRDVEADTRYQFVKADITSAEQIRAAMPGVTDIIHFAAESHVDRSIQDSGPFVNTNVVGTQVLLDAARAANVTKFVMVSTDEVYGSLGATGAFTETTPLDPSSPYSASKAAADLLVKAYHHTFGLPVVTTRCSNNYGPYQFPEKIDPVVHLELDGRQTSPGIWRWATSPRLDSCSRSLHRRRGGVAAWYAG